MSIEKYIPKKLAKEDDVIIPLPHIHEINKLNYELTYLKTINKTLKDEINKFHESKKQLQYLKEFRDMLSFHCIRLNIKITIFQCSANIERNDCNFYDKCMTRQNILKKLLVKDI